MKEEELKTGIEKVDGYLYKGKVYRTEEEAEIAWAASTVREEYIKLESELSRDYPNFIREINGGGTNWGNVVVDKMVGYMKLRTELIELANKNNKDE